MGRGPGIDASLRMAEGASARPGPLPGDGWRVSTGRRLRLALVVALALSLPAHHAAAADDDAHFFRIGTAATTGTYFQFGGVLASAISKPPGARDCDRGGSCGVTGLIAAAQATQGSIENLLAIGAGQIESGFAQSDVAGWAYSGTGAPVLARCKGQSAEAQNRNTGLQLLKNHGPIPNLRLIAALFPEDVQLVVKASSSIRNLGDLKGKRVAIGESGSGTIADARLVLEAAGFSECDIQPQFLRLSGAVEALQGGDIDAFFIVAGVPVPAVSEIASLVPLRLVPIEGATLTRLMGRPPFFHADTIPGGTYSGIDDPVSTVSVTALWIVGAAVTDDLAYAITRSLWQETTRKLLDFAHPVGKRIRIATALVDATVPLHPGAARYYAERGMELPPQR
jgi:hypothetical protein